jgi:hypothetical protein
MSSATTPDFTQRLRYIPSESKDVSGECRHDADTLQTVTADELQVAELLGTLNSSPKATPVEVLTESDADTVQTRSAVLSPTPSSTPIQYRTRRARKANEGKDREDNNNDNASSREEQEHAQMIEARLAGLKIDGKVKARIMAVGFKKAKAYEELDPVDRDRSYESLVAELNQELAVARKLRRALKRKREDMTVTLEQSAEAARTIADNYDKMLKVLRTSKKGR